MFSVKEADGVAKELDGVEEEVDGLEEEADGVEEEADWLGVSMETSILFQINNFVFSRVKMINLKLLIRRALN